MADYYPLIARALEGLSDKSPDMRRAVYERARAALMEQLRSLDPPLADADIMRERHALDDAIDRVEAEYDPASAKPALPATVALPVAQPEPAEAEAPQSDYAPSPVAEDYVPAEPHGRFEDYVPRDADGGSDESDTDAPARPGRPRIETRGPVASHGNRRRSIILVSSVLAVVLMIAGVAIYNRVDPETEFKAPEPVAEAPSPADNGSKFNDRVGGGPVPATPNVAPNAPGQAPPRTEVGVAQRAVIYEEDPANPQAPKASVGRVVWRLDAVNSGQGQPLETVVRTTIEYPEAGLSLNLVMRRNLDTTLPASHTVELSFTTQPGEPNRVVRDVGLLQFKDTETARGTPIAGLPVPVRDNLFLIGLSNLAADVERNTQLLLRRNWIDLPIRFASGQRAILSFEKGVAGEQVLNDAFRQWQ